MEYATDANLYVIVDWHILSDSNPLTHEDEAADFFSQLSAELGDRDNVIYENCNEPNGGTTWEDITSYAQRIIPLIRANDPDAIVIVGTPTWSQEIDKATAAHLRPDLLELHLLILQLRAVSSAAPTETWLGPLPSKIAGTQTEHLSTSTTPP